ncbi:MAG: hypothetical protein EBQ85_03300 [Proteobacteria bacterium]|nr:hypothetical protein [Pseudomonadota bacterium]
MEPFYKLQFALCALNFGAILFVQAVHYPLFRNVGAESFSHYHKLHVSRTSLLLGTTLFLEMVLNVYLMFLSPVNPRHFISFSLLLIGWLVTFFVSVPQHQQLEAGFQETAHKRLLFSNLLRVLAWGGCFTFLLFI